MTTSGIVICILAALLAISLLVNVWCINYANGIEENYLEWIEELAREERRNNVS